MKIGIIGPKPVPYVRGGTEIFLEGLTTYIHNGTTHDVELVTLDSAEHGFWDLIDSYRRFFEYDASRFDLVISTKYPSWMIAHDHQVNYMIHCLRGLYDTYHAFHLPATVTGEAAVTLRPLLDLLRAGAYTRPQAAEVFDWLHENRETISATGQEQFPGPLIREIVHFLDQVGLRQAVRHTTMSAAVKARTDYFPPGAEVAVLPPPTSREFSYTGGSEHFLTVSRLDYAKRIDLVIKAYRKSKSKLPLVIAGTGPAEAELIALAEGDALIRFAGFVPDAELMRLYADARALLYTPLDEDFGLVALEAMRSGTPVVTLRDSGGPTELVRDNQNGVIAADFKGLIQAIELLAKDEALAVAMGEQAKTDVADIGWPAFVTNLTGADGRKPRLVVATTYPAFPASHGGQVRTLELYRHLAVHLEVTLMALVGIDQPYEERWIAPGLRQVCIPQSREHAEALWALEQKVGMPIYDIGMLRTAALSTRYVELLNQQAAQSDLVVFCHPFLYPVYTQQTPVIYESQNVEYELKKNMLPKNKLSQQLIDELRKVETGLCREAVYVVATAAEDCRRFQTDAGISAEKCTVVRNGVDLEGIPCITAAQRKSNKERIGIPAGTPLLCFLGSWHGPNLEAIRMISEMAEQTPDWLYFIIGSAGTGYQQAYGHQYPIPPNLKLFGALDLAVKNDLMACCDIALNPVLTGSGTNLKLVEYLASGLPVVTTKFGCRGYEDIDNAVYFAETVEQFKIQIQKLLESPENNDFVPHKTISHYDWKEIMMQYKAQLLYFLE